MQCIAVVHPHWHAGTDLRAKGLDVRICKRAVINAYKRLQACALMHPRAHSQVHMHTCISDDDVTPETVNMGVFVCTCTGMHACERAYAHTLMRSCTNTLTRLQAVNTHEHKCVSVGRMRANICT